VIEKAFAEHHGVLVVTKVFEADVEEVFERRFRISASDREPEWIGITEVIGEARLNNRHDIAGDLVLLEVRGLGHEQIRPGGLAVVMIEVPLTTSGLVTVHQQARLAAHIAVEIFHAQLFAALRPRGKIINATDEARVGQDLDGHSEPVLPPSHGI
jgi:hypothetical protein